MKILAVQGGTHSCGLAGIEDGNIVFAFEEERFSRVKSYKNFEKDWWIYPVLSLENLI